MQNVGSALVRSASSGPRACRGAAVPSPREATMAPTACRRAAALQQSLAARAVSRLRLAIVLQFIARPEQSTRDEIEIDIRLHRGVEVPERSDEGAAFAIGVQ